MSMQYLWTPWRMAYISGNAEGGAADLPAHEAPATQQVQPDDSGCVFCDRIKLPPEHDPASLILLRAAHNFVILNLYPYNSGHLMVVPYRHTADFAGLSSEEAGEMIGLVQRMTRTLEAEYKPEGYNVGMNIGQVAGAGVADHIHMHLVPRWAGDTNFMPILGSTKVMPELLQTTYNRLKKRIADFGF